MAVGRGSLTGMLPVGTSVLERMEGGSRVGQCSCCSRQAKPAPLAKGRADVQCARRIIRAVGYIGGRDLNVLIDGSSLASLRRGGAGNDAATSRWWLWPQTAHEIQRLAASALVLARGLH